MPAARLLRLRRGVWRRLQNALRGRLAPPSAELRAYERDYRREARPDTTELDPLEVEGVAATADIVVVGDYHSFPPAQDGCRRLLEAMAAGTRPVALFVELARSRDQGHLDAYLRGSLDESDLLRQLDYGRSWGFPWAGYRTLLETSRRLGIPVRAMNGPGAAERATLAQRDQWAARVIARYRSSAPEARLLVMVGDLHLSRSHLPRALATALAPLPRPSRVVRVFQNHDDLYWKHGGEQGAVRLDPDTFCLFNGSPWEKLDSYLTWLETGPAAGIESMPWPTELDPLDRVLEPARALARFLGLKPPGDEVSVFTPDDLSFTASLTSQGVEDRRLHHVLESDVFPLCEGRSVYLARLDLAHAAEAAAELLVRGEPVGALHDEAGLEPFFARVRRRALTWFASKLLVPARLPRAEEHVKSAELVSFYARRLQDTDGAVGSHDRWTRLAAEDDLRLHLRVSRAVGRELGERMYLAFAAGTMALAEVRASFATPPATGGAKHEVLRLQRLTVAALTSSSERSLAPAK